MKSFVSSREYFNEPTNESIVIAGLAGITVNEVNDLFSGNSFDECDIVVDLSEMETIKGVY